MNRTDTTMHCLNARWTLTVALCVAAWLVAFTACNSPLVAANPSAKVGDEIIVCGQRFHIGAPVVLWNEGGYDFHFSPQNDQTPQARIPHEVRMSPLTDEEIEQLRHTGWTIDFLREKVDQFVIHYDVDGISSRCFATLEKRHLAVQLMLDLDGTIYQTMDLQEEAAHATKANGGSVGIEIANCGAYSGSILPMLAWYKRDNYGNFAIQIPAQYGDGGIRTEHFVGRPARPNIISANVQGEVYKQFDFTLQQYNSLTHLTAALCTIFPKITCDYPRLRTGLGVPTTQLVKNPEAGTAGRPESLAAPGQPGILIPHALTDEQYDAYQGVLGHYHVQTDKQDPGPAFQWERLIMSARHLMTPQALQANAAARGKPARFIPSAPKKPAATQPTSSRAPR